MKLAPLVLIGSLAACGHTRTTAPASAQAESRPQEVAAAPPPHRTESENGVPLATSSAGLLKPGAAKMIQQRLEDAGALQEEQETGAMDAVTRSALTRFQRAAGLPATGEPDADTVEKLGLKARDVFVSAPTSAR
jgi:peptidoglycan hydrolase-like protein with peptidoglycan-binding domain